MAGDVVLQRETFRTGASWLVKNDYLIRMGLGPWANEDDGLEEAQFMNRQFQELKRILPEGKLVSAIVDLKNIERWDNAHLSMLQIYAQMTKDPVTRRVAIVHATGMQKVLIVPLIKMVVHNRNKIDFFDDLGQAEAWVAAD
ncbi:MAG: hypothetical protein HYZ09_00690 [Candidatus Kerfeldbacteria bacterium]|nr:hypothetical protein [Candidatus Kerfeldbacteria bacterium]